MSGFRHNKKRNSGLVYEFLVRRLASTVVDKDPESYLKAVSIVKKYFAEGQPLHQEKEIFEVISKSRNLSETSARNLLAEMKRCVQQLNTKKVDIKKSNLIKEINYSFGKDFFDVHRVPEYRFLASVQLLIELYRQEGESRLSESAEKIQLEESLVKYMMSSPSQTSKQIRGEKVDGLVASLAMKKFEERYSGALCEAQKKTLRKFMNYSMTGNKEQFQREMLEEREGIMKKLQSSRNLKYFADDKVMAERMDEAIGHLSKLDEVTSDSSVQDILLFHRLVQEINSDE